MDVSGWQSHRFIDEAEWEMGLSVPSGCVRVVEMSSAKSSFKECWRDFTVGFRCTHQRLNICFTHSKRFATVHVNITEFL